MNPSRKQKLQGAYSRSDAELHVIGAVPQELSRPRYRLIASAEYKAHTVGAGVLGVSRQDGFRPSVAVFMGIGDGDRHSLCDLLLMHQQKHLDIPVDRDILPV